VSPPDPTPSLATRLADDLASRWARGERPAAEEYFARFPELSDQPEAALALIYEELCQRQAHGEDVRDATTAVLARFPQWASQLEVLVACHRLLGPDADPAVMPTVGESVGEFRLLAELGRGASGGVFLAAQPALADRPVVLKVTPRSGGEHLALARLQHTHVVPLYSAGDDPARGLRFLCMPYFGGASLARVLDGLADCPPHRRTGRDLLAALDKVQAGLPPLPAAGPYRDALSRATYPQAVALIGACLADALHDAHERGLVHFDLKPANILLAADGTPMLLDFHLAHPPIVAGTAPAAGVGGTRWYMAPEQAAAIEAVRNGKPVPTAVDGCADLYALGLVLYQALGGPMPADARSAGRLPRRNPEVSTGLADVLRRCLAGDPVARYPTGAALADDLRRYLSDQPLRGVPNRSLMERYRKWRRRRPYALAAALGVLALLAAGIAAAESARQRYAAPRRALADGQALLDRCEWDRAAQVLADGRDRAAALPFADPLRAELDAKLALAHAGRAEHRRVASVRELHELVERIRFAAAADPIPADHARALDAPCQALWAARARLLDSPAAAADESLRADLLDLAVIGAALRVAAAGADAAPARRAALAALAEAEALFGPSPALTLERARHARALGQPTGDNLPRPPRSAWEHIALGRALDAAGRWDRAAEEFAKAADAAPANFWAHFHLGRCSVRLGRPADAVASFTAAIALHPHAAGYYNRALAREAANDAARAAADFARAAALDPTRSAAVRTDLRRLLARDPHLAAARAALDRLPPGP